MPHGIPEGMQNETHSFIAMSTTNFGVIEQILWDATFAAFLASVPKLTDLTLGTEGPSSLNLARLPLGLIRT